MSDDLILPCRSDLFEVKKRQEEEKDVPYPMVFTFFDNRKSSPPIDKDIRCGGGVVVPYEKREENPYTITLIDLLYFEENPDQNPLLPNDIYAVNFIYDFLNADGDDVNLNDYLFEESAFKKYDAMEVLNRQKSWADLIPLAHPPALKTWKQLMAPPVVKDIPVVSAPRVVKDVPVVRAFPPAEDSSDEEIELPMLRAPPPADDSFNEVDEQIELPIKRVVTMDTELVLAGPKLDAHGRVQKGKTNRPPAPAPGDWIEPVSPVPGFSGAAAADEPNVSDSSTIVELSSDSEHDWIPPPRAVAAAVKTTRSNIGRVNYSPFHSQNILNFILKKDWLNLVAGNLLWKNIEHEGMLLNDVGERTWQSLRNHWQKVIEKDLDNPIGPQKLRISSADLKRYKTSLKGRSHRAKKEAK